MDNEDICDEIFQTYCMTTSTDKKEPMSFRLSNSANSAVLCLNKCMNGSIPMNRNIEV